MADSQSIQKDTETRMSKCVSVFKAELQKMRTGRAHPSLVESIKVNYYGTVTPLNQVAAITTEDARTLAISPWDKNAIAEIEKAIRASDLGLNPATQGTLIRVPFPPLTEERRKDLVKHVHGNGEEAKVAVRNIRRDAINALKKLLKDKLISEDEERSAEDKVQKTTDKTIDEIDKVIKHKEAELMEV